MLSVKTRFSRKVGSVKGYNKQIFKRRDTASRSLFLVLFTVLICGAAVFATGFKLGRQYQDAVVLASGELAAKIAETVSTEAKAAKD